MARTVILGAGFGGISVAMELQRLLGDEHEVVLIDRNEQFLMGLRKLWAVVGMGSLADGQRSRLGLADHRIQFVQAEIDSIDPAARQVETDAGVIDADYLVVALGAVSRVDLVPGLAEHGHDVWDAAGVPKLEKVWSDFAGGRVAVVVTGVPYPCPPAPFECVMLLDDHLRERGLRDRSELVVATLQPMLLPNAGRDGSAWLGEQLTARGIAFHTGHQVRRVEAGRIVFDQVEIDFDLLVGVPPHRAPEVVTASGLTGAGEWIEVDPGTLATTYPRVFAVGDVTKIDLANGLALPKAGIMAERQALRVAAAIAADATGDDAPAAFDGQGFCYVEMGKTMAALVEGEFFARPAPEVELREPSAAHAEAKHRFESERLSRWFGA